MVLTCVICRPLERAIEEPEKGKSRSDVLAVGEGMCEGGHHQRLV